MPLSRAKSRRLRIVMWFARQLGVPADVHQGYFMQPGDVKAKAARETEASALVQRCLGRA